MDASEPKNDPVTRSRAHDAPQARRRLRPPIIALTVIVAVVALFAATLRARYGGGRAYDDVTSTPSFPDDTLETVVTSEEPIGNVAVSAEGRLFFTIHPESRAPGPRIYEWVEGRKVPFPAEDVQARTFRTPLGLAIDGRGRLWVIDHGNHGVDGAKLVALDLSAGVVDHEHVFANDEAPIGSFLQDLRVDRDGRFAYIADVSFWRKSPALVVYDREQRRARRLLERHASVSPQDYIIRNPTKTMTFFGGLVALKAGVDGVALTADDRVLFFAAMSHDTVYRVHTEDLRDESLARSALEERVVPVGKKPLSDGLSADIEGNVLVTDVEHGGVVRVRPDGTRETLVRSSKIRWSDAVSYGPDRDLYIADSAIPDQMLMPRDHIRARAPYFIYRVRLDKAGTPGR
jgi:sugar lactone lactonase YvrE